MSDIHNQTPFETAAVPSIDKEGYDYVTVIIKGTFDIANSQAALPISEEQVPIIYADEFYGKPGESSIHYESDSAMIKQACDVILIGHAYNTKRTNKNAVDVSIQAGPLYKTVRVFGNRRWLKSMGTWAMSGPEPFDKMPLIYENAFGGKDDSNSNVSKHKVEQRNPVGCGFCVEGQNDFLNELSLPNIENPKSLIKSWKDKPDPVGFGFIGRDWIPRITYAGTYDESWLKDKCPLLPNDFNDLFYNSANPALMSGEYLKGGESVKVVNASKEGEIIFDLPSTSFDIAVWTKAKKKEYKPNLDTVIIEPDEGRVVLVWRATVPCFREVKYVERVRIKESPVN